MATDPSAFDPSQQLQPQQAGNLLRASIAGYGTLPDPQLVAESMQMGSAPTLTSALASGDPALQSAILSQPIGQSQFSSKGVAPPTALFNDPYTYDPKTAEDQLKQYDAVGISQGFKSFGTLPMANLGWYNSILGGDVPTVRKWQQFLADHGYYGTRSDDGKSFAKGEVNGYTSPQFQEAMKQWSLSYFLPQAIYSRNPQEITNARQYLSGLGFDTDAIASTMSHDPEQRTKLIDGWLQSQGPDGSKIDALQKFADHFGSDALPDQLNKLRGDGVMGSVGNFLGHIPGIGNLLGTTPEDLDKKLTPAEQDALNPDLQKAQDNSPFKFVGDVLGAPSKALVTAGWFLGDAVSGKLGKYNINPFDVNSEVSKFSNNPMQEIFGEQFVKDNPWLATFGNIAMNIGDDPLTFIPFIGTSKLAENIGKGIEGFDAMSKTEKAAVVSKQMTTMERMTGGLVSHKVGTLRLGFIKPTTVIRGLKNDGLKETLTKALDPIANAQKDVANLFTKTAKDGTQLVDHGLARQILGDDFEESGASIDKLVEMGQKGDTRGILDFLRDKKNGYADKLYDNSYLLHRHQYDKVLRNADKLSQGKQLHIWETLHMNDSSSLVNLKKPAEAVETYRNSAAVAGVPLNVIQKFANDFWKAGENEFTRRNLADGLSKEIEKAKGKEWVDGYHKWRNDLRSGSYEAKGGETVLYGVEHDPSKQAQELSWRDNALTFTKDAPDGRTAADLTTEAGEKRHAMVELDRGFRQKLDAAARSFHPEGQVDDASRAQALKSDWMLRKEADLYTHQMQTFQKDLTEMRDTYGGAAGKSPAPVGVTQTATWHHLPYTASEMMAYNNRVLRGSEKVQNRLGIDKAMRFWKDLVLSKPATGMRILFGDETSRFHINLLLNDPATWFDYTKAQLSRRGKNSNEFLDQVAAQHPEYTTQWGALAGTGQGEARHVPFDPGDVGYKEALTAGIENHYSKWEWVHGWQGAVEKAKKAGKDGDKAGQKFLKDFLRGNSDEARTLRDVAGVPDVKKGANEALDNLVATKHYDISSFLHHDFEDPERMHLWNWVKDGKVDQKSLDDLEAKWGNSPNANYVFPRIGGKPPTSIKGRGHPIGNAMEAYHQFTVQKINRARIRGWTFKSQSEFDRLKKFYTDPNGNLIHNEDALHKWAEASAGRWTQRNTYQGARSAAGSALRSVAPFWGATANANKFYLHTLIEHPEILHPFYRGEQAVQDQQASGGFRFSVPGAGMMLSHLGLQHGDDFTFEPFNASFLTREGFGGVFPGMGPIFNVALQQAPKGVQDAISGLPGMQYAQGGAPMLPWLENIVSGASLIGGGKGFEAPFIGRQAGYYDKIVDEKLQQMEANWEQGGRQGKAPTVADAKRDVGINREITGAAGFAAPIGLASKDDRQTSILDAEKTWDPGFTAADKKTFLDQHADVADYFKYIDPNTPETPVSGKESKQDILARSPWVLPYSTGKGQSTIPGRATAADTNAQYKQDVADGNIRTLTPVEYLTKVRKQEQITQAWNEFDRLQSGYQEFLQTTGVSRSSTIASAWRKTNYDPYVNALAKAYPDWGTTFVKQTSKSQTGLEFASSPFYSVSSFEVVPQNQALETPATVLWRAALVRRDQAVSALQQVMMRNGSQFEKNQIIDGLAQQIDQLSASDPTFASQIAKYRYSSLDDLVTSQAQQAATGATVNG